MLCVPAVYARGCQFLVRDLRQLAAGGTSFEEADVRERRLPIRLPAALGKGSAVVQRVRTAAAGRGPC